MRLGLGMRRGGGLSQTAMAISTLRRLGATVIGLPDDYGLVLGPELVSNGGFDSGAGWSLNPGTGTATISGGVASVNSTDGTFVSIGQNVSISIGKSYIATFDVVSTTGGGVRLDLGGIGGVVHTTPGRKTGLYIPISVNPVQVVRGGGVSGGSIDNINVREIISAQHFVDSTGTQPVTAIGDLAGLTLDRMGTVGVNTVLPTTSTTGWSAGAYGATITSNGTTLRVERTSTIGLAQASITTVVGKTYRFVARSVASSGGGNFDLRLGTSPEGSQIFRDNSSTTAKTYSTIFTATTTSLWIGLFFAGSAVGAWAEWETIELRELTGNHATQLTVANRPTAARVPKRLGPNLIVNGDFSNGLTGWLVEGGAAPFNVTASGGALVFAGSASFVNVKASPTLRPEVGKSYRLTYTILTRTAGTARVIAGGFTGANYSAPGTYTETFTATTTGEFILQDTAGTFAGSIDNIIVQEVLEWSPALDFDGSNDLLTLGSGAILQQGSDHFVTAAFVLDAVGVQQTIYMASNPGSANPFIRLITSALNEVLAQWRDDAGTMVQLNGPVIAAGTPVVCTMSRVGGTRSLWVNGIAYTPSTLVPGATTLTAATLGADIRTTTGGHLNGKLIDIAIDQGTLTDQDRKTIEMAFARKARALYYDESPSLVLDFASGVYSVREGEL